MARFDRTRRPRRPVGVLLLSMAMIGAACGGGDDNATTTTRKRPATTSSTASTAPPAPTAPLTGMAEGAENRSRVALVVKIDNAPKARPQGGINQADVVIEEGVEGGVTRLAAIFHSADAPLVGPVRSARTTDIAIVAPLNRPLFSWSGANDDFKKLIRAAPLVDIGAEEKGEAYHRGAGRVIPYNLFTSTAKLFALAPAGAAPPPSMFQYRPVGQAVAHPGAEPVAHVQVEWKIIVQTLGEWVWDEGAGAFRRTQNGTPHVDSVGAQVVAQNVVIQLVTYHDTGYVDQSNTAVPEADLVGSGEAWLLTAGKIVKGRWSKASVDALTSYVDSKGAPILLTPGRTWVELVPPGQARVLA